MRARLRGIRLAVVCLPAGAAITACIPSRDNPGDPGIRPTANLQIEHGLGPAGCSPDSISLSFSRRECLYLDASTSLDLQGDIDLYEYRITAHNATAHVLVFTTSLGAATGGDRALLVPARLRTLPPNQSLAATVVVHDRAGHLATSSVVSFTIENSAPVVRAPPPRVIPRFAAAWDTAATLTVMMLGGEASDPDDDELCYCWSTVSVTNGVTDPFPGGEKCRPQRDAAVTVASTGTGATSVFKYRVVPYAPGGGGCQSDKCDASLYPGNCSNDAFATLALTLDHPPAWATVGGEVTATARVDVLDVERRIIVPAGQFPASMSLPNLRLQGPLDYYFMTLLGGGGSEIHRRHASTLPAGPDVVAAADFPTATFSSLELDASGGAVWVWGPDVSTGSQTLFELDIDTLAVRQGPVDLGFVAANGNTSGHVDRKNHRLWIQNFLGDEFVECASGAGCLTFRLSDDPLTAGEVVDSIALRPMGNGAEPQAWIFSSQNPFLALQPRDPHVTIATAAAVAPAVTFRLTPPDPANPLQPILPVAAGFVQPDSTAPSSEMWLEAGGLGLVPVELLGASPDIDALSLGLIESPLALRMHVAPLLGEAIIIAVDNQTVIRARLDGSFSRQTLEHPSANVIGPDSSGVFFTFVVTSTTSKSPAFLERGHVGGDDGVLAESDIPFSLSLPAPDWSTGDLLVGATFPGGVTRLSPSGEIIDEISSVRMVAPGQSAASVPPRYLSAPSLITSDRADGTIYLAVHQSDLSLAILKVHPYDARPTARSAVADCGPANCISSLDVFPDDTVLAMEALPLTHQVMTVGVDGSGTLVARRYDASGMRVDSNVVAGVVFGAFSNQSKVPKSASDPVTGNICFGWMDASGTAAHLDSFSPALVRTTIATIPGPIDEIDAVAAEHGHCWMAWKVAGGGFLLAADALTPVPILDPRSIYPMNLDPRADPSTSKVLVGGSAKFVEAVRVGGALTVGTADALTVTIPRRLVPD